MLAVVEAGGGGSNGFWYLVKGDLTTVLQRQLTTHRLPLCKGQQDAGHLDSWTARACVGE